MVGVFVLLTLAPTAPSSEPPALVEVTVKPYYHPPELSIGPNGQPQLFPIDDGNFIEVTVKNTSKETMSIPYTRKLHERVDVTVTDAKGVTVSLPGRQNGFRRSEDVMKAHVLKPGESFTIVMHLEQNWPDDAECRNPGKYKLRVVFHCGKIRAESTTTFEREILN
jgi:hypothetical protein